MPRITITTRAEGLIRAAADPRLPFAGTSRPAGEGFVSIEVSDGVLDELNRRRMPGEALSDVIERAFATSGGRKLH